MRQIILIKGVSVQEFDYIAGMIKEGLEEGKEHILVYASSLEVEIEVIEIPDAEEKPTIIHNTYMGMSEDTFEQRLIEVFRKIR